MCPRQHPADDRKRNVHRRRHRARGGASIVRSPACSSANADHPKYHAAKIIPKRGVWLEIETDRRGIMTCKIDRKRKIPITQLLRVMVLIPIPKFSMS